ncbi:MAG TPA: hypothetical protein ENI23_14085 [bacterium]|nr:hypothetical protein [bacterium]
MFSYTFEKTSEEDLSRVVHWKTGDWRCYYWGKLGKNGLPNNEDGQYLLAESFIINTGWPKGPWFEDYLKKNTYEKLQSVLKEATERGTRVHKVIKVLLNKTENKISSFNLNGTIWDDKQKKEVAIQDNDKGCILSFQDFWNDHKPILLANDVSLYNLQIGYAGTPDLIWIITQECGKAICGCIGNTWKVTLPDLKATTGIRDSHGLQVASMVWTDNVKKYLRGYKIELTGNLRLGTGVSGRGYEYKIYNGTKTAENLDKFLLAKLTTEKIIKPFNPEKEIYQIKSSVRIRVETRIPRGQMKKGTKFIRENEDAPKRRKESKVKKKDADPVAGFYYK